MDTGDIPITSGQASFTVLEDWLDDMGMEYYFTAVDGLAMKEVAGHRKFYAYLKLTGSNIPALPNLSFVCWNWQLIFFHSLYLAK